MYIVSACLLGIKTRYDGGCSCNEKLLKLAGEGKAIPVCPEQLAGCPTPRDPCEIAGSDGGDVLDGRCVVISRNGADMTEKFIKGAEETLKIAKVCGVKKAILKARSPSCGTGQIYDGTFSGKTVPGNGVTAELLIRNGIEVYSEETMEDIMAGGQPTEESAEDAINKDALSGKSPEMYRRDQPADVPEETNRQMYRQKMHLAEICLVECILRRCTGRRCTVSE